MKDMITPPDGLLVGDNVRGDDRLPSRATACHAIDEAHRASRTRREQSALRLDAGKLGSRLC
jgi:hypothetical protein